jgi:hypothetical protein
VAELERINFFQGPDHRAGGRFTHTDPEFPNGRANSAVTLRSQGGFFPGFFAARGFFAVATFGNARGGVFLIMRISAVVLA